MKYRFGFILSTALGNKTRFENFKTFADLDPELEIVWAPVKHFLAPEDENLLRFLPSVLLKRAIVFYQSLPVLRQLDEFDAILIHMYEVDIFLAMRSYFMKRPLRVISTDDAPMLDPPNYPTHPADFGKHKWRQDIRLRIDMWRAHRADFLVPFSGWAADILVNGAKIAAEKVVPIHVGLNLNLWLYKPRPPAETNQRCRLLFVGSDFERKGGADLMAVFRNRLQETCELHLVTKQPPPDLPHHVHVYTDFDANDERLAALYRSSDIFVLPTHADLSSWVLLEAMASGCATISTPVGGIVNIVQHGKSGLLVAPGDLGGLASAITSLVGDPALRSRMGAIGRQLVERNFNAEVNVPRILQLMKNLVDASPASRSAAPRLHRIMSQPVFTTLPAPSQKTIPSPNVCARSKIADLAAVDLVLVSYRALDLAQALKFCGEALTGRPIRRRLLVLNNPSLRRAVQVGTSWEIVDGTNHLGEFSGWQEGLALLDDQSAGVVFINDSVCTHRRFSWARKESFSRSVRKSANAAFVGFRDRGQGEFSVAGMNVNEWTSTYCFMLSTKGLELLGRRLYQSDLVAACVPGGLDEERFFAELSTDLDAHLRRWLFGGGWYAGERLTEATAESMTFKAKCIIAEKLLSGRCKALGIRASDPFQTYPFLQWLDRVDRRLSKHFKI